MPVGRLRVFAIAGLFVTMAGPAPIGAQSQIEVGVLNCSVDGGTGFIFGSSKHLVCNFDRPQGDETYSGTITKFGLDLGTTQNSVILWTVLAPTSEVPPGALTGNYAGVSAEGTVGVGIGANALIGGSEKSIVLQPLSVQAQQGLNVAVGVASLTLRQ